MTWFGNLSFLPTNQRTNRRVGLEGSPRFPPSGGVHKRGGGNMLLIWKWIYPIHDGMVWVGGYVCLTVSIPKKILLSICRGMGEIGHNLTKCDIPLHAKYVLLLHCGFQLSSLLTLSISALPRYSKLCVQKVLIFLL